MDLVARLLLVSFFLVSTSHSLITSLKSGIKLKKETDSTFKNALIKISCYITYFAIFISCIVIVINIDFYKDMAACYLMFILVVGIFKHANFWKSDAAMRINKIMILATNLSLCGGLLLLIIRS